MADQPGREARRFTDCTAAWLALVLVAIKASFLGLPWRSAGGGLGYLQAVVAITYADVLFAAAAWATIRMVQAALGHLPRRWAARTTWAVALGFVGLASLAAFLAVVDVGVFSVLGGFLTYPMLQLVGSVRMVRSSVGAHLTAPVIASLISIPICVIAGSVWMHRRWTLLFTTRRHAWTVAATAASWVLIGYIVYGVAWSTRQERRIAQNGHWVLLASLWQRDAAHL